MLTCHDEFNFQLSHGKILPLAPGMTDTPSHWFLRNAGRITGPYTRNDLVDLRQLSRFMPFHELSTNKVIWKPAIELFPDLFGQAISVTLEQNQPATHAAKETPATAPNPGPETQYLYLDDKGDQLGPVPESQLRQMIQSGEIGAATRIWTSGMAAWLAAETQLGISRKPPKRSPQPAKENTSFDAAMGPRAQHGLFLLGIGLCLPPLYPFIGSWGLGTLMGLGGFSRGVARNALLLVMMATLVLFFTGGGFFLCLYMEKELLADQVLRGGLAGSTLLFCIHTHTMLVLLSQLARGTGVLLWAQVAAVMQMIQGIGDLFWAAFFLTTMLVESRAYFGPLLILAGFFSLITLVGMILAAFGVRQAIPGLKA